MTLPRVESGFGNSSCSSMASFMSGLLQENFGQTEISCGQIQIAIVDDNAKVEVEEICGLHRSRSLVTMRHHRSGRQLSRWACTYQRKDSDPNLMLSTRGPRKAPRGSSNNTTTTKLLTTTSDSMLLNLPTRTVSPRLTNGKSLTSTAIGSKGRLGNATWSSADVAKSTNRVVTSKMFDLSLDISTEEQKSNLNTNPFLMDRLSTMSLIDETKRYMPMETKLDGRESSPLRSDIPPMEAAGIRMPVRRPSVQPADHVPHHAATTSYPQQPQQQLSSKSKEVIPANDMDMLNSVTLAGSSSLNNMTRIRDPSALGFQMPNRQNRNNGSLLLPDNSLYRNKQHTKKSSQPQPSGHSSSSGMRRISSSSKGLGPSSFEESLRRSSSKSLNSKKFLNDPSLVGLNVNLGAR